MSSQRSLTQAQRLMALVIDAAIVAGGNERNVGLTHKDPTNGASTYAYGFK